MTFLLLVDGTATLEEAVTAGAAPSFDAKVDTDDAVVETPPHTLQISTKTLRHWFRAMAVLGFVKVCDIMVCMNAAKLSPFD